MNKPATPMEKFFNEVEKLCLKHLGDGSSWTLERDPEAPGPRHDMTIHCVGLFDGYSMEKDISLEGHVPSADVAYNKLAKEMQLEVDKLKQSMQAVNLLMKG